MSVLMPHVRAIIPLIKDIVPYARALYEQDFVDPEYLGQLIEGTQDYHFKSLHDLNNPLIKRDKDGREVMYMLWGHPEELLNSEWMIGMVAPKSMTTDGRAVFKPEIVLRGPKANVLIAGGMNCCGSGLQTHWSQVFQEAKPPIDDARIPVGGLPHAEHANWLKGRVHIAHGPDGLNALKHMAFDILAHRFPHDQRFQHDCGSASDYNAYSRQARTLSMG